MAVRVATIFDENRMEYSLALLRSVLYFTKRPVVWHAVTPAGLHAKVQAEVASWNVADRLQLHMHNHSLCQQAERLRPYANANIHVSALCKFYLPNILPDWERHVLFLDNDMIAASDISTCFDAHRKFTPDQYIGMVTDMGDICQRFPNKCWPISYSWVVSPNLICGQTRSKVEQRERKIQAHRQRMFDRPVARLAPQTAEQLRLGETGSGRLHVDRTFYGHCPLPGEREPYQFNGGVVLMDLHKMREHGFVKSYEQATIHTGNYIANHRATWADQDFINNWFRYEPERLYQLTW